MQVATTQDHSANQTFFNLVLAELTFGYILSMQKPSESLSIILNIHLLPSRFSFHVFIGDTGCAFTL